MRICVYGAGAIGGHLAARMATGGADVSVIVRGANLAAIRERGLLINTPDGQIAAKVTATDDPATLGPQDAVLVTAKAPALASIAAGIAPLLGPDTPVAFVLNGIPWWYFHRHGGALDGQLLPKLDPGNALREAVGMDRVIGGVVYSACTVTEPGVIQVANPRNRLVLGEPGDGASNRIATIAAPLTAGGFVVETPAKIRDAIWTKLLMNLGSGPVAVLAATAPGQNLREPALEAAARAVYAEGRAIADALGCHPELDIDAQIAGSRKMVHQPSILQDLLLGRPMEIDGIFDAPLALARHAGVATPVLDMLVAMVKQRARAAGLYPPQDAASP